MFNKPARVLVPIIIILKYVNPIQPGIIWTVNYPGGGGLCDPPVYLDNYATYRYEKLNRIRKKMFSF